MAAVAVARGGRQVRLSAVPNGWHAVRLTDHPDPNVDSGYSLEVSAARMLAQALKADTAIRVPTLEARMLRLQDGQLGEEGDWRPPWTLNEGQRLELADALLAAGGGS
jgi:hypothetical protein